jgi:hypothetical protein
MTRFFQRFNVTGSRRMNFREFAMALSACSDKASREEKTKCKVPKWHIRHAHSLLQFHSKFMTSIAMEELCALQLLCSAAEAH